MSARSCQLCGKPLSRIFTGSGGDFCSRDHRNQFRLRQGMGRLQEANKVASVMRRREQLRPLPNANIPNSSNIERRGFFQLQFAPSVKRLAAFPPIAAYGPSLRIAATSSQFIQPQSAPGEGVREARGAAAVRFATRRKPIAARSRLIKLPVQMQQAQTTQGGLISSPAKARRRDCRMSMTTAKRVVWSYRSSGSSKVRLLGEGRSAKTKSTASRGNALRVSYACGIRARKLSREFAPMAAQLSAKLRWREKRDRLQAIAPGGAKARVADSVAIPVAAVVGPAAPTLAVVGPPESRRTVRLPMPAVLDGTAIPASVATRPWALQDDMTELPEIVLKHWQPSTLLAVSHKQVKPSAVSGPGKAIHLLAPFIPQYAPCGFSFNVNQNGSKDQKR